MKTLSNDYKNRQTNISMLTDILTTMSIHDKKTIERTIQKESITKKNTNDLWNHRDTKKVYKRKYKTIQKIVQAIEKNEYKNKILIQKINKIIQTVTITLIKPMDKKNRQNKINWTNRKKWTEIIRNICELGGKIDLINLLTLKNTAKEIAGVNKSHRTNEIEYEIKSLLEWVSKKMTNEKEKRDITKLIKKIAKNETNNDTKMKKSNKNKTKSSTEDRDKQPERKNRQNDNDTQQTEREKEKDRHNKKVCDKTIRQ